MLKKVLEQILLRQQTTNIWLEGLWKVGRNPTASHATTLRSGSVNSNVGLFISYGIYFICWFGVIKKYYYEINKERYPTAKSAPWLSSTGWHSQEETSILFCDTLQVVGRFKVYAVSWENFHSSRYFWMSVAWCQTSGVHRHIKGCCTSPKPVRSFVPADKAAQACGAPRWVGSEASPKAHGP